MSPRLRIVLVAPRIAVNAGTSARTALALGAELHLVKPFGFQLDSPKLRRSSAGHLDGVEPIIYRDSEDFWQRFQRDSSSQFFWATKHGETLHYQCHFDKDTVLIFGNEEEGVPQNFWDIKELPPIVSCRIPTSGVRCLNLSVSVGIIGFEVSRQWDAKGLMRQGMSLGILDTALQGNFGI